MAEEGEEGEMTAALQKSECEKYISDIPTSCFMHVLGAAISLGHYEEQSKLLKESQQHLSGLSSTFEEGIFHQKRRWIELVALWLEIRITLLFPTMKNLKAKFGENADHPEITILVIPEEGHSRLGVLIH